MGGYGAKSNKVKGTHYTDTHDRKVTDKNSITVAEFYVNHGNYVAFLHEGTYSRADMSVDGHHVEVKGLSTLSPNEVEKQLRKAFKQVHGDRPRYPPETWREGKVIILSKHDSSLSETTILEKMQQGYEIAKRKNEVTALVEVWIRNKIYRLT